MDEYNKSNGNKNEHGTVFFRINRLELKNNLEKLMTIINGRNKFWESDSICFESRYGSLYMAMSFCGVVTAIQLETSYLDKQQCIAVFLAHYFFDLISAADSEEISIIFHNDEARNSYLQETGPLVVQIPLSNFSDYLKIQEKIYPHYIYYILSAIDNVSNEVTDTEGETVYLSVSELYSALTHVIYAAETNPGRKSVHGVCLGGGGDGVLISAATNGHQYVTFEMHLSERPSNFPSHGFYGESSITISTSMAKQIIAQLEKDAEYFLQRDNATEKIRERYLDNFQLETEYVLQKMDLLVEIKYTDILVSVAYHNTRIMADLQEPLCRMPVQERELQSLVYVKKDDLVRVFACQIASGENSCRIKITENGIYVSEAGKDSYVRSFIKVLQPCRVYHECDFSISPYGMVDALQHMEKEDIEWNFLDSIHPMYFNTNNGFKFYFMTQRR